MSFNPYEILTNLRRNSIREPIRAFDIDKSNDNNLSVLRNLNDISNQSITMNNNEKSVRQPFSLLSNNISHRPQIIESGSALTKNSVQLLTENRDRSEVFNQEAAIKLYKNKLVQEVPELLRKQSVDQEISIESEGKEEQNSIDYDQKIEITERNLEQLQKEFLQFKQDLKKELQTMETMNTDRRAQYKNQEGQVTNRSEVKKSVTDENENPLNVVTFKGLEKNSLESKNKFNSHIKGVCTERGAKPGTLKLGPFMQLKKKHPQFPQCVVRVDLKNL